MNIPESVREALERLSDNGRQFHIATDRDLLVVAEWAVENLLNSDDDEPVTEEWLRENGFRQFTENPLDFEGHGIDIWLRDEERDLEPWLQVSSHGTRLENPTRGQVRKLISALKGE